jgi:hypothetical protein
MPANDYHFITHWRLPGTPDEVTDVLSDVGGLARWWPSVYLDVQELHAGDGRGLGKIVSLYTKGWLPYTLRWQFEVSEVHHPHGFRLEAWGDFVGRGIWTFTAAGDEVIVTYDWKITAAKPLLRDLSFVLKPIFAANHHWAMRMGDISLRLELARRRARTEAERARIPAPPGPTFAAFIARGRAWSSIQSR